MITHGDSRHGEYKRLYKTWADMKNRCMSPDYRNYHRYGGRGIKVCDEWMQYEPFKDWALKNGYNDSLTISRIDINGNYEPSNCKWATPKEQSNNQTNTVRFEYNGESHTIAEWAEIVGLPRTTLSHRINKHHWPIEKALTTPAMQRGHHVNKYA